MLELLADLSNRHGVRVENLDDILPQAMRDAEHIAYLRIWEVRAGGEEPLQRLDRASHREWMRIAGYELDEELKPIKHYYLGDADAVAAAQAAVAAQGKAK